MKAENDLSKLKSRKNPYASKLKKPVTMRLSEDVVGTLKGIADETGVPNQSLINLSCSTPTLHKDYLPGSIGRIAELHARYYSELVGFGLPFESKVARELAEFCERYDSERDGLWLVLQDGCIEGSIAIDGSHAEQDGAHLRWFITSDKLRGTGMGSALLASAMAFCQARQYHRAYLWTFEGLDAARHLYEKFGFRLVFQLRGRQWGAEVNEQRFELQT